MVFALLQRHDLVHFNNSMVNVLSIYCLVLSSTQLPHQARLIHTGPNERTIPHTYDCLTNATIKPSLQVFFNLNCPPACHDIYPGTTKYRCMLSWAADVFCKLPHLNCGARAEREAGRDLV